MNNIGFQDSAQTYECGRHERGRRKRSLFTTENP